MARELFANNAASTLDGGIDNVVTTLDVADASTFPATGNFRILIGTEILKVTGVSSNTFTVERGVEGSSAASHLDMVAVTLILTNVSLGLLRPTFVRKTADETVTASTTLQDDDHLTFSIGASEIWAVRFVLFVDAPTASDLKLDLTVPSGATGFMSGVGLQGGATGVTGDYSVGATSTFTDVRILGTAGASAPIVSFVEAIIINSTNAGSVTLRWAQNTSDAGNTVLKAGSFLLAHHVG